MEYKTFKWLTNYSNNGKKGDSYAHVSYKRTENGETVEEYEKSYVNGKLVDENKEFCKCDKNSKGYLESPTECTALKEENKRLKEKIEFLEKENERLAKSLDKKTKELDNVTKAPICGGFMLSDEDLKSGNLEEYFRKAGEYMQSVLGFGK